MRVNTQNNNNDIAVIGGGAAGLLCVASIIEHLADFHKDNSGTFGSYPTIYLFEKNARLGAKVIISGGGRCNVTTGTFQRKKLLEYYPRGAALLDRVFRLFGPKKVQQRFTDHGVPLKQEDDGRIFPVSDSGKDVVNAFERLFEQHSDLVHIHYTEPVESVESVDTPDHQDGLYQITTAQGVYYCGSVVIASGGEAFSHTGSTGDGYSFARGLGHTVTPLGPSLNSFMSQESWIHTCSGISFPNAYIRFDHAHGLEQPDKNTAGPVLLTHFGITGPHVFVIASLSAFLKIDSESPLSLLLCPDVSMSVEHRDKLLVDASNESPKKALVTILALYFPKRFVESLLTEFGFSIMQPMSACTKEQRKKLAQLLGGGIPLHCIKRRPGDEFVTAGGVPIEQVDHNTLESTISPGLYFAGEILNVDGYTGGYNLQASRATGRVAGKAIAQKLIAQKLVD